MDPASPADGMPQPAPPFPSDEEAMRAIQAGHLSLLGVLYERHASRAHAHCLRLIGEATEADDLVQEAFLRVLRYRASFRGDARFSTWLYSIVRNVCMDHLRKRGRRAEADACAARTEEEDTAAGARGERVAVLRAALERLPADKRELLLLCRLEGLSYAQLAGRLGIREGTVRVRVHRAVSELRSIFDSLWEPTP